MTTSVRYRHKAIEVDAIEVTKVMQAAVNGTGDLLPKWVKDAIFESRLAVSPQTYGVICYPLPNVPRLGSARDWILHDPKDNTINVIPPETLRDLYELLEEPIEAEIVPERCPVCTSTGGLHAPGCPGE